MRVVLPGGKPLPAGASVQIVGVDRGFLSAPGGQVYLSGLQSRNVIEARWEDGACRFALDMPDASGPQPEQIGRAHVELQSLMRISYAAFRLKKKTITKTYTQHI